MDKLKCIHKILSTDVIIAVLSIVALSGCIRLALSHDEGIYITGGWIAAYCCCIILALALCHIWSRLEFILTILISPVLFIGVFSHWIKLLIVLQCVVLTTASIIIILLKSGNYLDLFNLPESLIYYTGLTLAAALSTSRLYGNTILSVTTFKKLFIKLGLPADYEVAPIRFSIYSLYLYFLIYEYSHMFYDTDYSSNKVVLASFVTYLAFDRVVCNYHLIQPLGESTCSRLKKLMSDLWTRR